MQSQARAEMIDTALLKTWAYCAGFAFLALLLTFGELLPLNTLPSTWVMPDVLLCVTFVCCIRRPQYVPMLIIAVVFFLQDLMLNRPPGLFAALTLMASEWVKRRSRRAEEFPFVKEYLYVALAIAVVLLGTRWGLGIVMLPMPKAFLTLSELLSTALFYPVVVLFAQVVLKVRRAGFGDLEATAGERT